MREEDHRRVEFEEDEIEFLTAEVMTNDMFSLFLCYQYLCTWMSKVKIVIFDTKHGDLHLSTKKYMSKKKGHNFY